MMDVIEEIIKFRKDLDVAPTSKSASKKKPQVVKKSKPAPKKKPSQVKKTILRM